MNFFYKYREENMKLFEELEYRGLIKDITNPDLIEKINNGGITFYIGVDPTGGRIINAKCRKTNDNKRAS